MIKDKEYKLVKFPAETLKRSLEMFTQFITQAEDTIAFTRMTVGHQDSTWTYDDISEFISDYRRHNEYAHFWFQGVDFKLDVGFNASRTSVSVAAKQRHQIESIFEIFESSLKDATRFDPEPEPEQPLVIFIGHGQSRQWRDLKDHLQDQQGYQVEAYETGARAGHHIRDILDDMASKSSFALLVLTAEDEQSDGSFRARQNVVHETGLFQGRLGFNRAIILLEEGAEEFSNVQGIHQIRYQKGNIKETFGDVLATLKREFG